MDLGEKIKVNEWSCLLWVFLKFQILTTYLSEYIKLKNQ